MSLVKVWTDVGLYRPVLLIAKIIRKGFIKYLSEGKDGIWRYENDTYEFDEDSIAEHLGTDLESDIGFIRFGDDGFIKDDYDSSEED